MAAAEPSVGEQLFTTVEECATPIPATVTGVLPSWLKGSLLRIGPAKFEWGDTAYNHWFDGDGLLHKFEIENGKVTYSSQYVRSLSYLASKNRGRIASAKFGTAVPPDPCKNIFSRLFSKFVSTEGKEHDNTNVNLIPIKERLFASTETARLNRVNVEKLETVERVDLAQTLGGTRGWLAHPHIDSAGTVYNLSTVWDKGIYEIVKVPPRKNELEEIFADTQILSSISFNWRPSYYHSFGMTENYFILFNIPFTISFSGLLAMMDVMGWSYKDMFKWDPKGNTHILIIDRNSGKVVKRVTTEKMFIFHHVNAYEEDGKIVIDVIGYDDASILDAFYLHALRKETEEDLYEAVASLRRYEVPMKSAAESHEGEDRQPYDTVTYKVICDYVELPIINYKVHNGKKYNFVYCVSGKGFPTTKIQSLVKINVDTGEVLQWSEEDCYPSEPIFVQSPDTSEEDDGVVLSAVIGLSGKESFLVVIDARTFQEVARATVSTRFAVSLHGLFMKTT